MRGTGPYAWQIGRRFEIATKKLGFRQEKLPLRTDLFTPPTEASPQLSLF
jgi:hypothetical protein